MAAAAPFELPDDNAGWILYNNNSLANIGNGSKWLFADNLGRKLTASYNAATNKFNDVQNQNPSGSLVPPLLIHSNGSWSPQVNTITYSRPYVEIAGSRRRRKRTKTIKRRKGRKGRKGRKSRKSRKY